MQYCSKCGTKLEEEDIYCPNCGAKKMDDDTPGKKSTLSIMVNMLLKPVMTAKNFVNNGGKGDSLILTAFAVVLSGLFGIWRASEIIFNINDIIINIVKKVYEVFASMYPDYVSYITSNDISNLISEINKIKSNVKIPYAYIFFQNCIMILASMAVVFLIVCIINRLVSKSKIDVFKCYKTAIIMVFPYLYFECFSIISSYFSTQLGIIIMLFGVTASIVCFNMIAGEVLEISEDHVLFLISISVVVVFIVISALLVEFIPSTISSIISSAII